MRGGRSRGERVKGSRERGREAGWKRNEPGIKEVDSEMCLCRATDTDASLCRCCRTAQSALKPGLILVFTAWWLSSAAICLDRGGCEQLCSNDSDAFWVVSCHATNLDRHTKTCNYSVVHFVFSCIDKWLKNQKAKCPQCNTKTNRRDIRPIYAKTLRVFGKLSSYVTG